MLRLRRLQPGSTATLKAIRCTDGSVTLDQTKMAAELAEHWAQVFAARPVNLDLLAEWWAELNQDTSADSPADLPDSGSLTDF